MGFVHMIHFDTRRAALGLLAAGILSTVATESRAQEHKDTDTINTALEEFVVTAQYQPQSLRKSVYKMNVIDQKRIQAKVATNAQQILSGELGIRFSNDMALGVADFSIMGMAGRGVKILLDGVPLLDRNDARESLNQINAAQIERIEIVEGPMSIVYGADAMAGVINIITKKPEGKAIQLNAQVNEETAGKEYHFGTGKGVHTQQLSGSWDNGKLNVLASVMHYDFGGWGPDMYNRDHKWKPKEQLLPSLRVGYKGKNWDVMYRNDYLREAIVTKKPINLDNSRAVNQFFTTDRMAHQLLYNHNWSRKWFLNTSLGYTDYRRYTKSDLLDYKDKTISPAIGEGFHDTAQLYAVNWRTSLLYVHSKKLSIQPGIEYTYDKATADRIEGAPMIANFSAFLTAEYKPFDKFNIRPGVRFTKNSKYDAPPLIPSINTLYQINDNISLRASYAQGYRAPAIRELYFFFRDSNHDLKGNENLKAENSHSFNASFTYKKPIKENRFYSTEISYFYNFYNNQIIYGIRKIINPIDSSKRVIYELKNADRYRTTGVSLANRFVTPKVEWRLGGLLLGEYNRVSSVEEFKGETSTFNWYPEVNLEMMYNILATKTRLNLFYKFTGQRIMYDIIEDANGNDALRLGKTASYSILDFNIQQRINPNLNVALGVRNLLNVTTLANTAVSGGAHSTSGNLPFSYGRSFFATLSYNFNNQLK
ncbi:MAG: TonB-dependent receptor [Sphingobacteriales bacterium]|nr:MAG: TonB-dependent receptor [Sphingobacteriales bacterium]